MGQSAGSGRGYQWLLVGLLSFNFGIVFFDRNALNFLMPFVQPELGLSNTQIGALSSALSLSWALAGLFVGRLSDAWGRRKVILVAAAVIFSFASLVSGVAVSFATLLAARLLMGVAEGGIMPISQALIATEVEPARRGLAMGITQNFGANLIGNFLGPVVLVGVAVAFGWRNAFYLAAAPGLLAAALMLWLIREPPPEKPRATRAKTMPSVAATLAQRNVWVCVILSVLLVAFLVVFSTFTPLYLVRDRGMDQSVMSWLMAIMGLSAVFIAFLVPGLSDLVGRRPVVIVMTAVGSLLPLSILFIDGAVWPLFVLFAVGVVISGTFPIVMATIPSETVQPHQMATALGLTMGVGEIIGGVLSPAVAGWVADGYGLRATLWIVLGLSCTCCALGFALQETAPAILRKRVSKPAEAAI